MHGRQEQGITQQKMHYIAYDAGGALFLQFSQQIMHNTRSGAEQNLQMALEAFHRRRMTNVINHEWNLHSNLCFED